MSELDHGVGVERESFVVEIGVVISGDYRAKNGGGLQVVRR